MRRRLSEKGGNNHMENIQELYHVSDVVVEKPDLQHYAQAYEFGKGFYLFVNREDALEFAQDRGLDVLNVYRFNAEGLTAKSVTLEPEPRKWLDYVTLHYIDEDTPFGTVEEFFEEADVTIVEGNGVSMQLLPALSKFAVGGSEEPVVERARALHLPLVVMIRTEEALDALTFDHAEEI